MLTACLFHQDLASENTSQVEVGTLFRDVFDQAYHQIYSLTEMAVFPRFVQSINAQMQVRLILKQSDICGLKWAISTPMRLAE